MILAALILLVSVNWRTGGPPERLVRDVGLFIVIPLALGVTHGRYLGWRINRRAIRNAILLSSFVLPFYVVGSTLPTIRAYYPMWTTTPALGDLIVLDWLVLHDPVLPPELVLEWLSWVPVPL